MSIVLFLMWRLTGELEPEARNVLVGTAVLILYSAPYRDRVPAQHGG